MKWIARSIIPAVVALAALVSFFPRSGPQIEVHVREFRFRPVTLTVNAGDSVAVINDGKQTHTLNCLAQRAQPQERPGTCGAGSGDVQPGLTKVVRFPRAGTYDIFCRYHSSRGMVGRLVVLEEGAPAPSPTSEPTGS